MRLIRDVQPPQVTGFDKKVDLLGNPRQRIAIITQMAASQRKGLAHTDITQLLILAKNSKATDHRDMIYAFYGLTMLTTFPDYTRSVEMLYADVVHMYVNSILWETYYSSWHDLSEEQCTHQLMSILYSAGSLHQHYTLPSWIPDWTYSWHLAPVWCKTTSNIVAGLGKDEWSTGVRCDFRAGGNKRGTFEIINGAFGMHQLRVSVIIIDFVVTVSETTLASTTQATESDALSSDAIESTTLRYGRSFFRTSDGFVGVATPGIRAGDELAIVLGGDVPVMIRSSTTYDEGEKSYKLLCECFVQSDAVMQGEFVSNNRPSKEDIVLV